MISLHRACSLTILRIDKDSSERTLDTKKSALKSLTMSSDTSNEKHDEKMKVDSEVSFTEFGAHRFGWVLSHLQALPLPAQRLQAMTLAAEYPPPWWPTSLHEATETFPCAQTQLDPRRSSSEEEEVCQEVEEYAGEGNLLMDVLQRLG